MTSQLSFSSYRHKTPSVARINGDGTCGIELPNGRVALFDEADLPLISRFRWGAAVNSGRNGYAVAYVSCKAVLMHRLLLNPPKDLMVDHVNGDGYDNRRCNIRVCTNALNQANKAVDRRNILGAKGVQRHSGKFRAVITHEGRKIALGHYETVAEASAAYFGAARALWGEFAKR